MSSQDAAQAKPKRKPMAPARSVKQIELELEQSRRELAQTIDELQDRLNVSKQAKAVGRKMQHSYQRNPVPWLAAAAGVAAAAGALLIWGATRSR